MNHTAVNNTMKFFSAFLIAFCCLSLISCGGGNGDATESASEMEPALANKIDLGESLFFDVNLSLNRTQSCSTCHDPDAAFIDSRQDETNDFGAISLGDDGISLGDRNAPTTSYASFTPGFNFESHARFNSQQPDYEGYVGGFFLDGRADSLQDQAAEPLLSETEMGMPDAASVVERLLENSDYVESFTYIYGEQIFDDTDAAFSALTDAIANFEESDFFSPFDSKYDRSLTGDYIYDPLSKSALGKSLFFSQQFTNCATCHQLLPNSSANEMFTNYEYHNIGVPPNLVARELNNSASDFIDSGLGVTDINELGKYKVPTLRNIAVTGPYMHNGVFKELKTVIQFYDHFLDGSVFPTNPETGLAWGESETPETTAFTELEDGSLLDESDVEALVCFLRTLTDARYEHLIEDNGIDCGE